MIVRLLAVDDDRDTLRVVKESFEAESSFRVDVAENAAQALERMAKLMPDGLILDWKLPDRNGRDLCAQLRRDPKTTALPIVMLTGETGLREKVDALDTGADDYVPKPFKVLELKARVRAVLRRRVPWLVQSQVLEFEGLLIDPGNYKVFVQKKPVAMTKVEFEILYMLAVNPGKLIQRRYIEDRALDMDLPTDSRPLDTHMSHLREKLGAKIAKRIETVRGIGYIFDPK